MFLQVQDYKVQNVPEVIYDGDLHSFIKSLLAENPTNYRYEPISGYPLPLFETQFALDKLIQHGNKNIRVFKIGKTFFVHEDGSEESNYTPEEFNEDNEDILSDRIVAIWQGYYPDLTITLYSDEELVLRQKGLDHVRSHFQKARGKRNAKRK